MKKITSILIASISLFAATHLLSCNKDRSATRDLLGTWTSTSSYSKTLVDGKTEYEKEQPYVNLFEYTLRGDKTYTKIDRSITPNITTNGTYIIMGTSFIGTYSLAGLATTDTTYYEYTSNDILIIKNNKSYTQNGKAYEITNNINLIRK